jgi:Holliday junction resolvase RusA-like endonuclease
MNPSIRITGEIHSSKNSRRIFRTRSGQPFIAKSACSKADEDYFAVQLSQQHDAWRIMTAGKKYPLRITFLFARSTKRAFDYVNMAQGILDSLVKAGYLPDDNMNYVIPEFLPYVVDKKNPGCDLTVR